MIHLVAFLWLMPTATPPQDARPDALNNIARDQGHLANQARRFVKMIATLESRARSEGQRAKADLLANTLQKLAELGPNADLAQRLENVATDLFDMRTGSALEGQAELMAFLEILLADLLQSQRMERLAEIQEKAEARAETLRQLAKDQAELKKQTQQAKDDVGTENQGDESEIMDLAEAQESIKEKIGDAKSQLQGEQRNALEKAEQAAEAAQDALQSSDSLEQALKEQEKVEEWLEQAADQAQNEGEVAESLQKQKELMDLLQTATVLAQRHQMVDQSWRLIKLPTVEVALPRSLRLQFRKWAEEESSISQATADLLFEVQEGGADAFPYLLRSIQEDHHYLALRLGPPNYQGGETSLHISTRLLEQWKELLDVLETEAQREREKIEGQSGEGSPRDESLVHLAEEVQLIKRLETSLADELSRLHQRQRVLHEAGIPLELEEIQELERLLTRQEYLRRMFESVLERYQQSAPKDGDNPLSNEPAEEEI